MKVNQQPIEIIAEIANAHNGKPSIAEELAIKAFEAGADAVKFQVYTTDELLVCSHPKFEHFKKLSFSAEIWEKLLNKAIEHGKKVYCDVFGLKSLKIVSNKEVYGYKVHSSDLGNYHLLQALAKTQKRLLIGVGGSTFREISRALNILKLSGYSMRPVLMHGFQGYPTALEDTCLARLALLKDIFGEFCDIGYMDHVDGDDAFAFILPLISIGMGAIVLEKHITIDRSARETDYYSALNPDEFYQFVEYVRRTEQAIGTSPEKFSMAEKDYRNRVKKHWVTKEPLDVGHLLMPQDFVMKRIPTYNVGTIELNKIIGRSILKACTSEYPITRDKIPQEVWALVVARLCSTRLPNKALLDVGGMPALQHLFERLKQSKSIKRIVLCTTKEPEDDVLINLAVNSGIHWYRGPTEDVLGRMLGAIEGHMVDLVVRVTGDDILVDPEYIDRAVKYHLQVNAEYSDLKKLPSGTEVEVFDVELLRDLWKMAKDRSGTEYLTTYVVNNRDQFRTVTVPVEENHLRQWRLTLDTPEDYKVIKTFIDEMRIQGKTTTYRICDIVEFFTKYPEILSINSMVAQRQAPPEVCTELDWRLL